MNTGRIGTALGRGFERLGSTLQSSQVKGAGRKALQWVSKINEPVKSAANPTMFAVALFTCVLGSRITAAGKRSSTEKREVITRDVFAISTLVFAMKAINGAIAKAAEKATGLILTSETTPLKGMKNPARKFFEFIRPSKGVSVWEGDQIVSKYAVSDAKGLKDLVNWLGSGDGNASKALTAGGKKSPLTNLANSLFGDGIKGKNAKEIIGALDGNPEVTEKIVNILNSETNPLIKKAKLVNSGAIKTLGLAVVVAVLGIGIQMFNQFLTKRLDKKKAEGKISHEEWERERDFIYRLTPEQTQTFQNFLGFRQNQTGQ